MSNPQAQQLLQQGVLAAKAGNKEEAYALIKQALELDPQNESALLALFSVAGENRERLQLLKQILEINPNNDKALGILDKMGIAPERLIGQRPAESITPETAPEPEEPAPRKPNLQPLRSLSSLPKQEEKPPAPTSDLPPWMQDEPAEPAADSPTTDDLPPWMQDEPAEPAANTPTTDNLPPWMQDEPVAEMVDDQPVDEDDDDLRTMIQDDETETEDDLGWMEEDEEGENIQEEVKLPSPTFEKPKPKPSPLVDLPLPPANPNANVAGVPVPNLEYLRRVTQVSDDIVNQYLEEVAQDPLGINWVKKEKRRAGERDIWVLRSQILAGILTFIIIVGGSGTYLFLTNEDARRLVFDPTHTLTFTPTVTPTATLGVTPTPSRTPELSPTPSPTLNPTVTPGRIDVPPEPTSLYRVNQEPITDGVIQVAQLLEDGEVQDAFEILEEEKSQVEFTGNPYPYYFSALAYLQRDDPESANIEIEQGFDAWQSNNINARYNTLLNLGQAKVRLYEVEQELQANENADVEEELDEVQALMEEALTIDTSGDFTEAYIALSDRYRLEGDYEQALTILEDAQELVGRNYVNTLLRLAKANLFLDQEEFERARQTAEEILYIDPFAEDAYKMRIAIAIEQNKPGDAVIFAERYLFFYPGSVTASKLLGDARKAERKFDLAIEAYTRALQGNINDVSFVDTLVARAEIYLQSGRYELAERDFTEALRIANDNPEVRELRMLAAYQNNNYSIVLNDITVLSRLDDEFPQAPLDLFRGRVLMDRGRSTSPTEVLDLVTSSINQGLPDELVPIAYEYQARAYYELEQFDNALNAINESLARQETGNRHYLRGLIQQAREETEDAILEYDWVLTWSQIYPYPFRVDARNRYDDLKELVEAEA